MGLGRTDTIAEALEMARDVVGPSPSVTCMYVPPLFMVEVG